MRITIYINKDNKNASSQYLMFLDYYPEIGYYVCRQSMNISTNCEQNIVFKSLIKKYFDAMKIRAYV